MIRMPHALDDFATLFRSSDANYGVFLYRDNTTRVYGYGSFQVPVYCVMDFSAYPFDSHKYLKYIKYTSIF